MTPDDVANGYTDYVIWNRLKPECLDIDGELPMECLDSGLVLLKEDPGSEVGMVLLDSSPLAQNDVLRGVLEQAYKDRSIEIIALIGINY